jgi:hypothetical protein
MACTYCQTSRACKCVQNCANCFRAKELYLQILADVHDPQIVELTVLKRRVETILPKNNVVNEEGNAACVDKTQDFQQDEATKKEKRKQLFREKQTKKKHSLVLL